MNIIPLDFKNAINLEHGSYTWPSRILFLVLLLLNLAFNFNPYASNDFTGLIEYLYSGYDESPESFTVPLTQGNIIYALSLIVLGIITVIIVGIFSGHYANRLFISKIGNVDNIKDSIPVKKHIGWIIFVILATVPFIFSAAYSFIVTIIALPVLVLLPSFYLNDDCNIFRSIGRCIRNLRRAYLRTMNVIILIYLSYYLIDILSSLLIYQFSSTAAYVISSFAAAWCWTALGRYAGARYSVLKYMKGANPFQTPHEDSSI